MGPYTVDPMARINTYTKQYFKKPENTEKIKVRLFKIEINIEKVTEFWASMGVVILLKGYCMIIKIKQIEHFSLIF